MSKASSIVVNGENNLGGGGGGGGGGCGGDFGNRNVNMVAMMDSRSNKSGDFSSNQDKCPKLYSCDFDHMYASVNDVSCTGNQLKDKETKHLKELLLLHLDLIQQQSEQIVTKDKQIAALKEDYETLKLRFERMERRVTLKRHRGSSNNKSDSIVPQEDPANANQVQNDADLKLGSPGTTATTTTTTTTAAGAAAMTGGKEDGECGETLQVRRRMHKRNSQEGEIGKRRRVSTGSGVIKTGSSSFGKKKRTVSLNSDKVKQCTVSDNGCSESERKARERTKLKTESAYYTIIGECDVCWSNGEREEVKEEEQVQVPTWREKPIAPCYVMEGTENLGDDVFSKRHQRLEIDERRRKRWDIQRIREQNHVDKLKQKLNKHQNTSQSSEHPISSFFPSIDDLEEISIDDRLPVLAFGLEIPLLENSEFSLPWSIHLPKKQKLSPAS